MLAFSLLPPLQLATLSQQLPQIQLFLLASPESWYYTHIEYEDISTLTINYEKGTHTCCVATNFSSTTCNSCSMSFIDSISTFLESETNHLHLACTDNISYSQQCGNS
jgi:hypothetical protein